MLMRRVYRVLLDEWDPDDAEKCVREDWQNDARGEAELGREGFMDALFELVRTRPPLARPHPGPPSLWPAPTLGPPSPWPTLTLARAHLGPRPPWPERRGAPPASPAAPSARVPWSIHSSSIAAEEAIDAHVEAIDARACESPVVCVDGDRRRTRGARRSRRRSTSSSSAPSSTTSPQGTKLLLPVVTAAHAARRAALLAVWAAWAAWAAQAARGPAAARAARTA